MQDLLATMRGVRPCARTAEIIGRRIVSGGLVPGSTLPNSEELAAELSVSRPSVRAALRELADKGLIEDPHGAPIVRPRSHWRLDADVLAWQIADLPEADFVGNLFEVRRIIEPDAAAIAARRGDPATISGMERALVPMASTDPRAPESIRADLAFHKHLLTGTGNEFIAGFAPLIETLLLAVFRIQRNASPDPDKFVPDHRAVVEAIKRGDATAARKAAAVQLEAAERDAMDGIRLLAPDRGSMARSIAQ